MRTKNHRELERRVANFNLAENIPPCAEPANGEPEKHKNKGTAPARPKPILVHKDCFAVRHKRAPEMPR